MQNKDSTQEEVRSKVPNEDWDFVWYMCFFQFPFIFLMDTFHFKTF